MNLFATASRNGHNKTTVISSMIQNIPSYNRQSAIRNPQSLEVFHHHQITPGLIILSVEDRSAVRRSTQVVDGTSHFSERRILMSAQTQELKSVGLWCP